MWGKDLIDYFGISVVLAWCVLWSYLYQNKALDDSEIKSKGRETDWRGFEENFG